MTLSTIIPEFLLSDRNLLAVYCYCVRLVQPENSKSLINGQVVSLRPYEVCTTLNKSASDLGMVEELVEDAIKKLSDLELIELGCEGDLRKIRFKYIVLPSTERKNKNGTTTDITDCWLDEFIPEYLEYVKTNLSAKTFINYMSVLNTFSKWFGRKKLSEITAVDLEKYKNQRKGNVSDETINIHVRTLKAALEVAKKWGKVVENPFREVKHIRVPKKSIPSLTKEEYLLLRKNIKEQWLHDIIDFNILTGFRLGEIANLRWSDINFENEKISIQSTAEYQVKCGKMRTIPLHDEVKEILAKLKKVSKYVFVKENGKNLRPEYISKKFKSYIRKLGLPEEYHFHMLRATFATWCDHNGVSPFTLQKLLGHSSIKVTESYISPDLKNIQQQLSKISLLKVA